MESVMKKNIYQSSRGAVLRLTLTAIACLSMSACSSIGSALNPFQEPPTEEALLGQPNDHALNSTKNKTQTAREALEVMASYERANYPQPAKPVMKPPVVRLMWIPDHLNRSGDLVPAHYYYLKVKDADWAVQDAFELEAQLHDGKDPSTSNLPWVDPN